MGGSFSESGAQSLFDLAEVNPKANDLAIEECCSIDMVETLISFLMQSTPRAQDSHLILDAVHPPMSHLRCWIDLA